MIPVKPNTIDIISWNVNGIRSAYNKGFTNWFIKTQPYILCIQEIRIQEHQLNMNLLQPNGYYTYWCCARKPGYSGTAILTKEKPISIKYGIDIKEYDDEGRTIIAEFPNFVLINCYFPNGRPDHSRVSFKINFYRYLLELCNKNIKQGKKVIFCGDVNTAHKEIDLFNPSTNRNKTGFLPEERLWLDQFVENGFSDSLRQFFPNEAGKYTWWNASGDFKKKNLGWRFDYIFISNNAIDQLIDSYILSDIALSDHCPVGIKFQVNSFCNIHPAFISTN